MTYDHLWFDFSLHRTFFSSPESEKSNLFVIRGESYDGRGANHKSYAAAAAAVVFVAAAAVVAVVVVAVVAAAAALRPKSL